MAGIPHTVAPRSRRETKEKALLCLLPPAGGFVPANWPLNFEW